MALYDRAWGRLQALQGAPDPEIAILTGRMFIARGWNNKARKAMEKALLQFPNNRLLSELFDQASEPPTEPDFTDANSADWADGAAAIAAAKHYMAAGSLLKARAILEQLKKTEPDNPLIGSMLWALDGDFSLEDFTLVDIARRYGTGLQSLNDLPDEAEHTETASIDDILLPDESGAFPPLFRNMEPPTEFYGGIAGDDEVTHVSAMAGLDEMKTAPPEARVSSQSDLMPAAEVTEIQMVVRKDGAMEEEAASAASNSIYDLATLPPFHLGSDLDLGPEQEDADVIVHTRREDDADDQAVTHVGAVQLDIEPEVKTRQLNDEAATWAAPPPAEDTAAKTSSKTPPPAPEFTGSHPGAPDRRKRARKKSNWPWWVAALAGVVALSAFILAAVALPFLASLF